MRILERAVRELSRIRDEGGERRGLPVAIASGVAVSMPVARTFLGFDAGAEGLWLALPLAGIAFACTTAGTLLALRASTAWRATLWVLASNVVPPTLVCAPTIVGLFISVPSGFAAFVAVLPFALLARRTLRAERSGHAERARLIGAALTLLSAAGLLAFELSDATPYRAPGPLDWAPAIVAAITSLALAGSALALDASRALVASRVARGELPGYRLGDDRNGSAEVERVASTGEGPHRTAATTEALGALPRSAARIALGALACAAAVATLGAIASASLG